MCSLAGEVMLKENIEILNKKIVQIEKCKKCLTEKSAILLRKKDSYCNSCFLQATVHKFRATVGKYRISNNERVLILYRIGHPMSALLHFIKTGLEQSHHKKLRLVPIILYIDDHYKLATEERLGLWKNVCEEISFYNFPAYFTVLHNITNFDKSSQYIEFTNDWQYDTIRNMLDSLGKSIEEFKNEDIININRRNLLIDIAKKLDCKYAFTTEINVDVAVKLLGSIALGRGSQLSLDVGECDDRDPDVKIIQPLRYFEMKELAFYNIFNDIMPVVIPAYSYRKMHSSNINKLLSKFVFDLQDNYPSTVNTVVRTGDKLACDKTDFVCKICKAPVEIQEELSSSEASSFSHWISVNASNLREQDIGSFIISTDKSRCYSCEKNQLLLG